MYQEWMDKIPVMANIDLGDENEKKYIIIKVVLK